MRISKQLNLLATNHKKTLIKQIPICDDLRVLPGHDYIENNLQFTLEREPGNQSARALRTEFKEGLDAEKFVSTIGLEPFRYRPLFPTFSV